MNKYEFLSQLRNALSSLPKEEREAAMSYYEEFFSDAGEENEQAVIASLGTPESLAQSIIAENDKVNPEPKTENDGSGFGGFTPPPTPAQQANRWTGGQLALIIVLAVLASPIWLGLLSAVLGVIVGLIGALIGLYAGFGAGALGLLVGGAVALFTEPTAGIFLIGIALILGGLIPLAVYPLSKAIVKLITACVKGIGSLFNRLTGKKEARQ
ncbi:MAG: DUF1700 domain-containing protein [Bacteroides sp.]|nr:DUF1700 domain-containing protein [Bacteroides sp.]